MVLDNRLSKTQVSEANQYNQMKLKGDFVYIVLLEWFDEEFDNLEQESRQYFFDSADITLNFVNMITRDQEGWERFGCPKSVYLYKALCLHGIPYPDEYFSEENCFMASWVDCDEYLKN